MSSADRGKRSEPVGNTIVIIVGIGVVADAITITVGAFARIER